MSIHPDYQQMARRRIESEWRVLQKPKTVEYGSLFGGEAA